MSRFEYRRDSGYFADVRESIRVFRDILKKLQSGIESAEERFLIRELGMRSGTR